MNLNTDFNSFDLSVTIISTAPWPLASVYWTIGRDLNGMWNCLLLPAWIAFIISSGYKRNQRTIAAHFFFLLRKVEPLGASRVLARNLSWTAAIDIGVCVGEFSCYSLHFLAVLLTCPPILGKSSNASKVYFPHVWYRDNKSSYLQNLFWIQKMSYLLKMNASLRYRRALWLNKLCY